MKVDQDLSNLKYMRVHCKESSDYLDLYLVWWSEWEYEISNVGFWNLHCVMKLPFVCAALKSTCEVNITNDQQPFALLTCRFSEPVKDFFLELKRPADSNKRENLICKHHCCTRFVNV